MSVEVLLSLHLVATVFMVGLIWFVHVVHYPLFGAVGADGFAAYEREHQRRTAWVVGPPMAVEGVTALLLLLPLATDEIGYGLPIAGLVVLAAVHASTLFLQVPAHGRLEAGFDAVVADRLVVTNWIRTIGWSVRGVLATVMVFAV